MRRRASRRKCGCSSLPGSRFPPLHYPVPQWTADDSSSFSAWRSVLPLRRKHTAGHPVLDAETNSLLAAPDQYQACGYRETDHGPGYPPDGSLPLLPAVRMKVSFVATARLYRWKHILLDIIMIASVNISVHMDSKARDHDQISVNSLQASHRIFPFLWTIMRPATERGRSNQVDRIIPPYRSTFSFT